MYSLVGDLVLNLILAINSKVVREIPEITYKVSIKNVTENIVEYYLSYYLLKHNAFCILNISVAQYDPKELFFEVYAELNEFDFEESDLHKINIENLMLKQFHLRPVVTEGITRYFDTGKNGKYDQHKSTAKRTFKVKYRALTESVKEKEEIDNYRFDEMSERVFPYIKSLSEIFKVIHPDHENLK